MEGIRLNGSAIEALSRREKTNRPDGQKPEISEEKLKKACADFESIFINYMLKTMRLTIPQSGTNKFAGKDIYSSMIDQKVAEDLAKRGGGIGLQEMLLRQLKSGIGGQGSGIGGQETRPRPLIPE
ncbi:MAG: rod-binding protein [Desulfobacterales bacterium]|nr:rod-binding protein [Desulfobacterales bacterium]